MATQIDPVTGKPKVIPGQTPWIGSQSTVDDSMAAQVTNLASKDSYLNQMARTEGLKAANRRGLLNSSMAVGASQDAVLKNVIPIASQDAAQAFAKNQAAKAFEFGMTAQEQGQGFQTSERLGSQAYGTSERLGAQAYGTSERLGTQKFQTGERLGAEKFAGTQAQLDRNLETALQAGRITSAEKVAFAQIASTEGINAANNALQWNMFNKDIAFRVSEGKLDRAQATAIQNDAQAFEAGQNAALRKLNSDIAKMNLSGTQQQGLSQAILGANASYQEMYRSIMSNPDLDAGTRTQYLNSAKTYFNDYVKAAQRIYNTNIQWGK